MRKRDYYVCATTRHTATNTLARRQSRPQTLPDREIEGRKKTLVYLDLDEIKVLFELYGKQKVKRVWLERLVPQGDYLYTLNRFFAWFYFRVKKPEMYVKSMETRILNRRMGK